ncbi:MAG: HIT family protein [Candidatus Woesearchaeota archaeon]|jgi:histidine triad (HIT) family protein
MTSEVIIQDEDVVVLTPKRAYTKGHIIITTVNEYKILEEVPPNIISKMFQIANKLSGVMFDLLKCHGTNILIQNGVAAGQINSRFSLNIIPRFENDKLKLDWTPTPAAPEKIQESQNRFHETDNVEKEKKFIEEQKAKVETERKSIVIKSSDDKKKRNYFMRSLEKVA